MDEVISQTDLNVFLNNHCVLCENVEYRKKDYENLCYVHRRKLLWTEE